MNILWISIIFTAWYILALVISENLGKKRRIGVEWSFFFSMMLSPVIGLIVTFLSKEKEE